MSIEKNKALVRRYVEAINQQDYAAFDDLLAPALRTALLPDWETLPYDQFSPHQDLVSERLATLYRMQRGDFDVMVVPAPTALVRLCPPSYIASRTFFLKLKETLDSETLRAQLATAGYQHVTQVVAPGEVCFRGGLIDLFPTGSAVPYRIDLDSVRNLEDPVRKDVAAIFERHGQALPATV